MVLTACFCSSEPSCTPSRASLLTGRLPMRHGLQRPPMYGEKVGLQGEVTLNGEKLSNGDARYGIDHGMSYVPEDRNHVGSSPNLSVTDNVIMKNYRKPPIAKGTMLDMNAAAKLRRS